MKNCFLIVLTFMFFIYGILHSSQTYKGRIVGDDRSRIEDVTFEDSLTKEEIEAQKFDDLGEYIPDLPAIDTAVRRPSFDDIDDDLIPVETISFSQIEDEYEVDKESGVSFERVQPTSPDRPRRMRLIMYNLVGFFVLLALF